MPSEVTAHPSVAILTVNTNGEAFVKEFAESLAKISYPNYSLVVVDNGSTDNSLDILERLQPQAVVLRNKSNLGFTGACNRGLTYCLSQPFDYVLFLNNDLVVEPDFLDHLVTAAGERTMTVPKSYLYDSPGRLDDSLGEFDWMRGRWKSRILGSRPTPEFDRTRPVESANLSCLLVPIGLFREVGLLDDNFFIYYDDTDFVRRARQSGYELWFVPSSVLHHRKGATIGGSKTAFGLYYLTRNRPYLIRKHIRSPLHRTLFWLYFLSTRAVRMVALTARGRPDLARATLFGVLDYCRGRMGKTIDRDGTMSKTPPHAETKEGRPAKP